MTKPAPLNFSFLLSGPFLSAMCQPASFGQGRQSQPTELKQALDNASFEFSNEKIYRNEAEWKGKIISISGTMPVKPVIGKGKENYFQIIGTGAYGPIDLIVYLDAPMPTTSSYGNQTPVISTGERLRVFGIVRKTENFVAVDGYWLLLPTIDCIAIFKQDDQSFLHPLWTSRAFK